MKKSRFSEEQKIGIIREGESGNIGTVAAKYNIGEGTYYRWKRKYRGMNVSEAKRLRSLEEENGRLKRLVADQAVQIHILKEVNAKKMVSPSTKRRAVKMSIEEGWGKRSQACRALGIGRSSYYHVKQTSPEKQKMKEEIIGLSQRHPRYGYRRITALLRRGGHKINAKRVARIRREEGIKWNTHSNPHLAG